jgi:hypothetical protein
MKINFINSWKSTAKQDDKLNFELRVFKLTFFKIYFDISRNDFSIMFLNFGFKNS